MVYLKKNILTAFFYLNRPGNFSSHARSCLELLIDVLTHLNDRSSLLFVTQQLKSKVDPSRFILRVPYMHLYIKVLIVVNFFSHNMEAIKCNVYILRQYMRESERQTLYVKVSVSIYFFNVNIFLLMQV